jgi:hypothetical protein
MRPSATWAQVFPCGERDRECLLSSALISGHESFLVEKGVETESVCVSTHKWAQVFPCGESIVASRLNWSLRHLLDLVSLPSVWRFKEVCEAFVAVTVASHLCSVTVASHLVCNTQMPVHSQPLGSYVS